MTTCRTLKHVGISGMNIVYSFPDSKFTLEDSPQLNLNQPNTMFECPIPLLAHPPEDSFGYQSVSQPVISPSVISKCPVSWGK